MGKRHDQLQPELIDFIRNQKIFFVGTAMAEGRVNISPKGMDSFRVLGADKIAWLNLTGSGNETATHLLQNSRMTIMFCSFEGKPLILRLYGQARVFHVADPEFEALKSCFPDIPGARQIIEMDIELVQSSCGYAVPFMDFVEERTQLQSWAEKQGPERLENYWKEKNSTSLDGHPTPFSRQES